MTLSPSFLRIVQYDPALLAKKPPAPGTNSKFDITQPMGNDPTGYASPSFGLTIKNV